MSVLVMILRHMSYLYICINHYSSDNLELESTAGSAGHTERIVTAVCMAYNIIVLAVYNV